VPGLIIGDDWPQWRGPGGRGIWSEKGIVDAFPESRAVPRWTAEVSSGYSAPSVASGRVYLTDRFVDAEGDQFERVLCFDAKNGDRLWKHQYTAAYQVNSGLGPRAAPVIAGGRVFALGTMGHLHALDAKTGAVLWKKQLVWEYSVDFPTWGMASAPLLVGNTAVVHVGGRNGASIIGLDVATGSLRWRVLSDQPSYSTPVAIRRGGKTTAIVWTGENIVGLDPLNGKVAWQIPTPSLRSVVAVHSPVISPDGGRVFVSSFYEGSKLIQLSDDGREAEVLWSRVGKSERRTDGLHSMISSPIWDTRGKYIFGIDSYGALRCLSATDGSRVWSDSGTVVPTGRWATVHMVRHGTDVWMLNEQGDLMITELNSDGVKILSKTKVIEATSELNQRSYPVAWAHPAFADGCVFVRNDRELRCVRLRAAE